jgi:hypothetical protein
MTYGQRGQIQTWARALAQLHVREDGAWHDAENPRRAWSRRRRRCSSVLDILAPIAALEREACRSGERGRAVGDLEDEIPAWLSAIEYEADDEADDEAGETAEADDWTAAPGELRTVATEG